LFLMGFVKGLAKGLNASGVDFGKTVAEYVDAMLTVSELIGEKVGRLITVFLSFFDKSKTGEGAGFGNVAYELTYRVSVAGVDIASKVNEIADTIISEFEKYRDKISKTIASIILSGFSINLDVVRTVLEGISVVVESLALAGKIGYSIAGRLPTSLKGVQYGTQEYKNAISTIAEQVKAERYAELSKVYSDAEIDKMVRTWTESFADFYMQLSKSMEEIAYNVLSGGIDWAGIGLIFLSRFFEGINKGLQDFVNWAKTPEGKKTLQAFEESFGGFVKEAVRFVFKFTEALFTIMPSVIGGIAKGLKEANLPELFAGIEDEWNNVKASLQANLPSIMASILDIMMFGLEKWDDVVDIFGKSFAKNSKKIADLFYKIGELILSNAVVSSELVKGAVKGFEQYLEALLNAPDGSEMAKEWEKLKNNIQKTATSFVKAAVNFASLGAELGVSFFEGLSKGFEELEKDPKKLNQFHTAVQNAVKSAVEYAVKTLPETLNLAASILKGIADGISSEATKPGYTDKLKTAIENFVNAGLRAAVQGAWFVTEFGKEFAEQLVATVKLLDMVMKGELDKLQPNKNGEYIVDIDVGGNLIAKSFKEADLEALKKSAKNIKETFRTFLGATPIAADWLTGFVSGLLDQTSSLTGVISGFFSANLFNIDEQNKALNVLRNSFGKTNKEIEASLPERYRSWYRTSILNKYDPKMVVNIAQVIQNVLDIVDTVAKMIGDAAKITLGVVIRGITLSLMGKPETYATSIKEQLSNILMSVWEAAFVGMLFSAATGFSPMITIPLAVILALTFEGVKNAPNFIKEVKEAFSGKDSLNTPLFEKLSGITKPDVYGFQLGDKGQLPLVAYSSGEAFTSTWKLPSFKTFGSQADAYVNELRGTRNLLSGYYIDVEKDLKLAFAGKKTTLGLNDIEAL
ncbi:MAG: hypothetical protein ACP5KD_08845, partial [Fervidobacterium sp.]